MNRYSFSSESDRWWVPSALIGTVGASLVGVILAVPLVGAQAIPAGTPGGDEVVPAVTDSGVVVDRPCYLARAGWNTPAGWAQPVCSTELRRGVDVRAPHTLRSVTDYLP